MRQGTMHLIIALGLTLMSCGGTKQVERAAETARKVEARVETTGMNAVPQKVQVSGTVEARTKSVIAAQVMGVVKQMNVEVGQMVGAGQVLVVIDSQQLAAGAAQAEAGRAEARSALLEANAAIEAATTQLELARSTRARLATLFERKSLTQQEMDEANARVRQAEAGVGMARAKKAQVEARIAQADQAVSVAMTQKGYATLVAPFAGVVSEKMVQVGAMAVPGAPLLSIERSGGFRVALEVDEKQASGVRIGMPVRVTVEDRAPLELKLNEIVPSLDPSTRSMTVKADLPAMKDLRSGAFARAEWSVGSTEKLTVAESAVRERGQLQMVFVVEAGKARSRMVTLGDAAGGRREVLSGLKAGEIVVVSPVESVEDGVLIEVRQ